MKGKISFFNKVFPYLDFGKMSPNFSVQSVSLEWLLTIHTMPNWDSFWTMQGRVTPKPLCAVMTVLFLVLKTVTPEEMSFKDTLMALGSKKLSKFNGTDGWPARKIAMFL